MDKMKKKNDPMKSGTNEYDLIEEFVTALWHEHCDRKLMEKEACEVSDDEGCVVPEASLGDTCTGEKSNENIKIEGGSDTEEDPKRDSPLGKDAAQEMPTLSAGGSSGDVEVNTKTTTVDVSGVAGTTNSTISADKRSSAVDAIAPGAKDVGSPNGPTAKDPGHNNPKPPLPDDYFPVYLFVAVAWGDYFPIPPHKNSTWRAPVHPMVTLLPL